MITLTPEKFWSRVQVGSESDCWPFLGARLARGYGVIFAGYGETRLTHRLAFYFANGHLPFPMCCHTCDNPPCCNPRHLYEGDCVSNVQDMVQRGRNSAGSRHGQRISEAIRVRGGRTGQGVGERNPRAVLTDEQVAEIRRLYAAGGISQNSLAKQFGVSQPQVSRLVLRTQRAIFEE